MTRALAAALAALLAAAAVQAHEVAASARYLANEGVMVTGGKTKIVFDPLFNEDFGQYRLVPQAMRRALLAGEAPWDGVDAIFISHYHDDHFAPADVLAYLRAQPQLVLYAPQQAVAALHDVAAADDNAVFARVHSVALAYGDAPRIIDGGALRIEALRIPHAGWPAQRSGVENIAWRVTLDAGITVLHLGDADSRTVHFEQDAAFWAARQANMAFPPYWYFLSPDGRRVLDEYLRPMYAIGIHVPRSIPAGDAARPAALQGVDLFTQPGESRGIPHDH
ncbi:MAG TPA: MBL fold metallo-hydrolase [Woeseiaceae bacterium]|nr:MBL fold metallo-hydrolase [Woeseiaceae bacterium]